MGFLAVIATASLLIYWICFLKSPRSLHQILIAFTIPSQCSCRPASVSQKCQMIIALPSISEPRQPTEEV